MSDHPGTKPRTLVVASMRRWVADEFAAAAAARGDVHVVHSWGLDVPRLPERLAPAWWTPTEHAARLRRAGVDLPVLTPGPTWLAGIDQALTGRPVWAGQLADIDGAPRAGWAKPAEAKVAALPAAWWDDTACFATAARAAGLPLTSWVQVSPNRLDLDVEHRCFVLDRMVLATSPYLLGDGTTYHEGMEQRTDLHAADAAAFAADVAAHLGREQPPAYVLDVARTTRGTWVVLEANPVWASAAYGADPAAVLDTVLAGVDYTGEHARWLWRTDPWLTQRADAQSLLPRR